jgi:ABC-type lipoprotein release transport system permease subunit
LLAGRDFTFEDRHGSVAIAIVSKSLADRLWPGESGIGKQIVVPVEGRPLPAPLQVIGIAADSRYRSLLDAPPPLLYVPLLQNYDSISRLIVALDAPPTDLKDSLRRIVQQTNPDLPMRITTMREQLDLSLWRQRAASSLLSVFGVLALALACAGINGVVAYGAAQRNREIGIRMALGASRVHVLGQVVGQAIRLTAAGIVLGLPLALWARSGLATVLYDARGIEPLVACGVPLLFVTVAVAASLRPARRAAATDPVIALRQE